MYGNVPQRANTIMAITLISLNLSTIIYVHVDGMKIYCLCNG